MLSCRGPGGCLRDGGQGPATNQQEPGLCKFGQTAKTLLHVRVLPILSKILVVTSRPLIARRAIGALGPEEFGILGGPAKLVHVSLPLFIRARHEAVTRECAVKLDEKGNLL